MTQTEGAQLDNDDHVRAQNEEEPAGDKNEDKNEAERDTGDGGCCYCITPLVRPVILYVVVKGTSLWLYLKADE
jgi:hypothetical protein